MYHSLRSRLMIQARFTLLGLRLQHTERHLANIGARCLTVNSKRPYHIHTEVHSIQTCSHQSTIPLKMLDEVHSSLRYLYPAKMFSVRGCLLFVALRLAVFWEETAFCPTRYLIPLHPGRAPMKQSFSDLAPADHRV